MGETLAAGFSVSIGVVMDFETDWWDEASRNELLLPPPSRKLLVSHQM